METFISARSPLFAYTPCRECAVDGVGWSARNGSASEGMGGGGGRLSIALNFTGTGIAYQFAQPIPAEWISRLLVNASTPPLTANLTSTSISNLPIGTHRFALDLFPPPSDPFSSPNTSASTPAITFTGATGYLGLSPTTSSRNITIDDTAWRSNQVILSPGWNMLEGATGGVSNWINQTQVDAERPTLGQNYNSSVSWTETWRANTTILFSGEGVWVYGVSGGEAGRYEVVLDNRTAGVYNASGGIKAYNQLLYHTSSLPAGNHTVTLRNLESGKRLSFDRLVAVSGLMTATPVPAPSPSATLASVPAGSSSGSRRLSGGAVSGIIVGSIAAATCIMAALFLLCKRRRRSSEVDEYSEKPGGDRTFFSWPKPAKRPFFRIGEGNPASVGGVLSRVLPKRKSGTWTTTSGDNKTSFISGLESPSLPPPLSSEERYTSFMKFSKSPKRERARPPISSPIPMKETRGDMDDDMTPAMAAAISGRTMSPLSQLRNGTNGVAEDQSYLPKMTTFGGMLAWSPHGHAQSNSIGGGGGGGGVNGLSENKGGKRSSMDTIGRIFGQYGSPRHTLQAQAQPPASQQVGMALGSPMDQHGWETEDRKRESVQMVSNVS